jgi:hypothetical protein
MLHSKIKKMLYKIYKPAIVLLSIFTTLTSRAQFQVTAGTHFVNTGTVVLDGHFINNGTFINTSGSNIAFNGQSNQMIQGSGTTQFYGLEIAKPSNNIWLQTNIKVNGPLKFTKGSLDLTYNSLQLIYPNGLLQNESEQNRIFATGNGVVFIEQPLNAPNNVNPGNLGFSITSQNNLGLTAIYRGHDRQTKANGELSISRYYYLQPSNNQNINASYEFRYFDAELNGLPENGLQFHSKEGAAEWQPAMINGLNTQLNIFSKFAATSLHRYTVFPAAQAPLPLQLLAFTAQCKNNDVQLQWITANEANTKDFTVEKSTDGLSWQSAGIVASQQNIARQTYTHTTALDNSIFFRLKMADADGSFSFSPVKKLDCGVKNQITVGPNPTTGQLKIAMQVAKKDKLILAVTDAKGSTILNQNVALVDGLNVHVVDLSAKPSGVYLVKIWSANGIDETHRIIKR